MSNLKGEGVVSLRAIEKVELLLVQRLKRYGVNRSLSLG
jgi:hypothetical protein